jgi:hypothetical protein
MTRACTKGTSSLYCLLKTSLSTELILFSSSSGGTFVGKLWIMIEWCATSVSVLKSTLGERSFFQDSYFHRYRYIMTTIIVLTSNMDKKYAKLIFQSTAVTLSTVISSIVVLSTYLVFLPPTGCPVM